uniref:Uncharacterized protein n=1 Tax=Meloidogyne floridensis TaxID=298350 RepID=A0A915NLJ8_9BILA
MSTNTSPDSPVQTADARNEFVLDREYHADSESFLDREFHVDVAEDIHIEFADASIGSVLDRIQSDEFFHIRTQLCHHSENL